MAIILLVEDDLDITEALSCVLEGDGHTVLVANCGIQGIESLKSNKVDAIFLDHHMPISNGEDFCRMKSEQNLSPETPVILMSAVHDGSSKAKRLGLFAFLKKPFDIEALIKIISSLPSRPNHSLKV